MYGNRKFRRQGLRSLQKASVLDGVEPRTERESATMSSSVYWQPTRHELQYLKLTTPALSQILEVTTACQCTLRSSLAVNKLMERS